MIKNKFRIAPKNLEERILEFVNENPRGVTGQIVAKKFNLMPHMAGKQLRILHRHGKIGAFKPDGFKDSWTYFHPLNAVRSDEVV